MAQFTAGTVSYEEIARWQPHRPGAASTVEEERREVFDSIIETMRTAGPDRHRRAACVYLLRHLARTEQRI